MLPHSYELPAAILLVLGGALACGVMAIRDAEIAIEKEPARRHDS